MKIHKIRDFLIRQKDVVEIEENTYYKRLTIKTKNQGVSLRDEEIGANIGTKKQFVAKGGQFIVSKIDAMNGAFGIIPVEINEAIITGNFWTYNVDMSLVNIDWFNMFVSLPSFIKLCEDLSSGTTHRKYLDENKFSNYEILLPSISEQNSIVENYIKHKALSDDLLQEISKQEKYVSSLRQAILQQAVEGKLCEQDPEDEPASVLLEKIKAEKEKLIAEKKIKKQKELPPITEEEKPFDLPLGWEWCRMGDICEINPRNNELDEKECSFIPMNLICDGYINHHGYEIKKWKTVKSGFTHFKSGDIGVAKITPCFENRKSVIFNDLRNGFGAGTTELHILRASQHSAAKYILNVVKSNDFIQSGVKTYTGTAGQQRIGKSFIELYVLPLPPLAEQQRIVEKVDKLMALCDELEQEVTSAKKYAIQLMEAVLQEAFTNKPKEAKDNVVVLAPQHQQANITKPLLSAAARGKMSEATWQRITEEAMKLASEES